MSHRVLTPEEIEEAKKLKEQEAYSKRKLARRFEVGETTIWENIYRKGTPPKRKRIKKEHFSYRKLKIVIYAIKYLRSKELNSKEVAQELEIPHLDVNFIYSHHPTSHFDTVDIKWQEDDPLNSKQ